MEKVNLENPNEKLPSIRIVSKKTQNELVRPVFGRPISLAVSEFVKMYAILDSIAQKAYSEKEAGELILDLWEELDVKLYEPEDIFTEDIIKQALSAKKVEEFSLTFNGGPINIRSGSTTESVLKEWQDAKHNSPDAIKEREANRKEYEQGLEKNQDKADKMFADLEKLDFKNTDAALQWLMDYNKPASYGGVNDHMEDVIKKFEENGYSREKNNKADFMVADTLKDKQMMKENFIGYLLVNMGILRPGDVEAIKEELKKME